MIVLALIALWFLIGFTTAYIFWRHLNKTLGMTGVTTADICYSSLITFMGPLGVLPIALNIYTHRND